MASHDPSTNTLLRFECPVLSYVILLTADGIPNAPSKLSKHRRQGKEHMASPRLKIRTLQNVDAISARVPVSSAAGDASPFYARCPSIVRDRRCEAHPLADASDKLHATNPSDYQRDSWRKIDLSSRHREVGPCVRCRGTRVRVGQFFSRNSGCIQTSVMSRTAPKRSKRFCYSAGGVS